MNDYQILGWIIVGVSVALAIFARVRYGFKYANRMVDEGLALVDKEASK